MIKLNSVSSADLPLSHIGCATQKQGKFIARGPRMPR